jgi:hypothetical protein
MRPANAPAYPPPPKPGEVRNRPQKQVVELQNLVFEAAKKEGSEGKNLSSLARAWCDLEERRRILKGRPLPGSYRPEKHGKEKNSNPFAALKTKRDQS